MLEMTEAAAILHARHRALAGADGRDRPRHLHLRRPGAGRRHRRATCTTATARSRCSPRTTSSSPSSRRKHAAARSTCTCRAVESGDDIVFLHEIAAGPGEPQLRRAGGAAGRHAGGAGAPGARHARGAGGASAAPASAQIDLFAPRRRPTRRRPSSALEAALAALDPDTLTPARSARRAVPPEDSAERTTAP